MIDENETETIIITQEEAGIRLDKVLAERYEGRQSRTYFQYLINQQLVYVNGTPVKKRTILASGDEVEIHFVISPELEVAAEEIPLHILFEDEHLLIVNKPVGMVVHPAPGNWSGTFVNALLHHCRHQLSDCDAFDLQNHTTLRPGIVHRLDKETSGILVAAKTLPAQRELVSMFAQRLVHKEYIAICLGNPGQRTIDWPIGRHPVQRKMMAVIPEGKPARTHCRPLAIQERLSLVSIELETGRTHQIRVHMKHQGTPILGDSLYGNSQANSHFGASRQMLHARMIRFRHPIAKNLLEVVAPMPSDMLKIGKIFGPIFLGQL